MADLTTSWDEQNKNTDPFTGPNLASQVGGAAAASSPYESVFGQGSQPSSSDRAGATPPPAAPTPGPQPSPQNYSATPAEKGPDLADAWSASYNQPSTPDRATATATAPPSQPSQAPGGNYADLVSKMKSATDPQQRAMMQDQLARNVFGSLKDAGHDVSWDGDQLMVDGRAYVVGDGQGFAAGEPAPGNPQAVDKAGGSAAGTYHTNLMEGDAGKLADPARAATDPKYSFLQLAQQNKYDYTQMPQMLEELKAGPGAKLWQGWQADGKGNFVFAGDPTQLDPSWKGVTRVDAVGAFGNIANGGQAAGWRWGVGDEGGAPAGGGAPSPFDIPRELGAPGAAGVPTGGGPAAPADPGWDPTAPSYTPGAVDMSDLQGFGLDQNLGKLGPGTNPAALDDQYEAGSISNDPLYGNLGDLGAGRTDAQTEDLISSILQHPESLSDRDVEMLKAASKDELADMSKTSDEDLVAQGYRTGNADSNWLQSERNASKGQRDTALVQSNRNIDINAAQTRAGDRRAAATLGASYADSKNSRNLANRSEQAHEQETAGTFKRQGEIANEGLRGEAFDRRTKVSQQNIENQFRSTAEKQTAFKLASDTALAASAQKGDRMALEEQIKQKATELGQSADTIRQNYVLGLLHDATTKYGIDVGASIDRAKLSQAGAEFQQDLIFRLMQLRQQDQQFGASYGLDAGRLQLDADNSAYDHYKDTFGD